jgi:hypothetical protein
MKKSWSRIKAAVTGYNYGQALEKIAFTTIGLLLALWINNWNDQRKALKEERELLAEIKVGLLQDQADINQTAFGHGVRAEAADLILRHIEQQLPETDSLRDAFQYLYGFSFLLANTGGYETLKSKGLETIRTDSLRMLIVTLYDVDYERVRGYEDFNSYTYRNIGMPFYYETLSRRKTNLTALNWPELRLNNKFRELIIFVSYGNHMLEDEYKTLEKKVVHIMDLIDRELE